MASRNAIFGEVENACACCGLHGLDNLTIHHIDHDPSNNKYDNEIVLCHNCHHRYHNNKGISKEDIENLKRILITKTLTQYGINALKSCYSNSIGVMRLRGTSMILCFTWGKEGDNEEACQEKQG